jgi:flagellar basal body P-ring protein FlgI
MIWTDGIIARLRLALAGAILVTLPACTITEKGKERYDLGVEAQAAKLAESAAFRDTIGSVTTYEGLAAMRVRGYGLVVGLGKNGSTDCPKPIYERLVQSMYKQHRFGASSRVGVPDITPEAMINDIDTAVVVIYGDIPPAATEGTRFDVNVMALPGTQTKSLRGGRLFTADLEMYRVVSPDVSISGRVLAHAAGPVFINPFSDEQSATQVNELEGVILSGGVVTSNRRLRLVLTQASYQRARQIQDRINAQFPGATKVADAVSPSFVQIEVPTSFRQETGRFLNLVRSLYLSRDPSFESDRARKLAEEMLRPEAPHAQIASCFEGLGRKGLPALNELYANPRDSVSFYSAAAGLRLGDHVAGDVLAVHAANPKSPFRFQAIHALGEAAAIGGTAVPLRKLLLDEDPRVQVAAYEALIRRRDPAIQSIAVGGDNFVLDVIRDSPTRFAYVKRNAERRIALFGRDLTGSPPALYRSADGGLTLSAREGDEEFTVVRTVVSRDRSSPPLPAPFELAPLLKILGSDAGMTASGGVLGLGLDYGAVVHLLYHLCQNRVVSANFQMEEPNFANVLGPGTTQGRPESDL